MKRLYFLTDDIDKAEQISNELHREGISDWNFHVMSKDAAGLKRHHLHSTNVLLHEKDTVRAGERGAMLGVAISCLIVINW
jgi:hypothetical protein